VLVIIVLLITKTHYNHPKFQVPGNWLNPNTALATVIL